MANCTRVLKWGLATFVAAALAGFGNGATTAQAEDSPTPDSVAYANPRSSQPQSDVDKLPDFLQAGEQSLPEIDASSTRSAGTADGVQYWTAVSDSNELCLIALLPGDDEFAAMSCADAATLATAGAAVQATTPELSIKAVFVPGIDLPVVGGFNLVGTNLLVGDGDIANLPIDIGPIDLGPIVGGVTDIELPGFSELPQ